MSKPRYVALNHDTYAEVIDVTFGGQVSKHNLIRDAEAEAVRLNAAAGKRAALLAPLPKVYSVGVPLYVVQDWIAARRRELSKQGITTGHYIADLALLEEAMDKARVRIEEIEE